MTSERWALEEVCEKKSSNLMQKDLNLGTGEFPIYGASGLLGYVDFYQRDKEYIGIVKDGAGVGRAMLLPAKSSCIGTMEYLVPKDCISSHYLYYAVESMNLAKYNTGATIPHIYFRDYKKETLPKKGRDEQEYIASNLDKVVETIRKRRAQLQFFDDLVKSQFIEMFGEIGSDKNGWGIHPLVEYCDVNPKKGEDTRIRKGMEVSFVPMQSVSEQGDIDATAVRTYEEVQNGFTYFSEGDVLFAKITPCMENGKGAIARGLKNSVGFGSTEFHVLRPKAGVCNSEWIYAITSFPQFRQDAAKKMTGSAGQRRVPASFLASYLVSCPPFELQERFARFVEQTDKSKVLLAIKLFFHLYTAICLKAFEKSSQMMYNHR